MMKQSKNNRMPITQKQGAGCSVACVAYILNISYDQALKFFGKPKQAVDKGFLCQEIVDALKKANLAYSYGKVLVNNKNLLKVPLTIVFIARSKKYPIGHFLVRSETGFWMNPWVNFPCIASAESGYQKRLPGKAQWIIYPVE